MKRAAGIILPGLVIFWSLAVLLNHFPPGEQEIQLRYLAWSQARHIPVPDNYYREMPFPLPIWLLSVWPARLLFSDTYFRLPNLIIGWGGLALLYMMLKKQQPEIALATIIIFGITPWVLWMIISDTAAVLTLFMALLITVMGFNTKVNQLILIAVWLGLCLTSLSGLVFGVIFGIRWVGKQKMVIAGSLMFLAAAGISWQYRGYIYQQSIFYINGINNESISKEVDQRVRDEFKLDNFQNIVPLFIKRWVYNKPFYWYRAVTGQILGNFSVEKLAYPAESSATVTRSLWDSKDLPWLLFWEVGLVMAGGYFWRVLKPELGTVCGLFGVWSFTAMGIFGNNFLATGIGLTVPVAILAAMGWRKFPRLLKGLSILIVIFSLLSTYDLFFNREMVWRDNRPEVQMMIAKMAKKYQADYATAVLGRSFLYYAWLVKLSPENLWTGIADHNHPEKTVFESFNLKSTAAAKGRVYVGFPGEFLGNRKENGSNEFHISELPLNWQLLASYPIHDTVSFGNGDFIWTVKIN